ncbi:solute carrier family 23 member 1 [Ixodes scapularis]|uniref:solute carrier family 23 member 1 n=1 Tax=Ixodes scapularis TaxID=6945 RepID=UPI001A9F40E7|nr:solute carrier family 23 member 1 [Ixodes scapularis]
MRLPRPLQEPSPIKSPGHFISTTHGILSNGHSYSNDTADHNGTGHHKGFAGHNGSTNYNGVSSPVAMDKQNGSAGQNGTGHHNGVSTLVAVDEHTDRSSGVLYQVNDTPPWYLCLLLGFQHYLTMMGGVVSYPFLLAPKLCLSDDDPDRAQILSTILFVSGIGTLLQATFGVRLPVIQGSTFAHLVPILAVLSQPQWQCPSQEQLRDLPTDAPERDWKPRMCEIQGAIMVASAFEVVAGLTGLVGLLTRWITPLGITPTIALIGLSLFPEASQHAQGSWPVALGTVVLVTLFSQYLRNVRIPVLGTRHRKEPERRRRMAFFSLFPIILTIGIMWLICLILTLTDAVKRDSTVRTDTKLRAFYETPTFSFSYPFQWGMPTVSVGAVVGLLAGVLVSVVESVGDYHACARLSGAPPPPVHAINRGIFVEGLGSVLAAAWGAGCGLTSYSENIGAIGITKVASRRVIQFGAGIMLVLGMVGKVGALFVAIPEPIMGGIFIVMFSVVSAVGLSSLQFVNLNSSRNLFVLGASLFLGLCLPDWIRRHPQEIATGSEGVDQVLRVLLSTSMFVGGFVGIFLDNTIPGTAEERGLHRWTQHSSGDDSDVATGDGPSEKECYDPPGGAAICNKLPWLRFLPISPSFRPKTQ